MSEPQRLVVFGATSLLVATTLRHYAQNGAQFLLFARNASKLQAVGYDLLAHGAAGVTEHVLDVNDFAAVRNACQQLREQAPRIDILLLGHGVLSDQNKVCADSALMLQEFSCNFLSVALILTELLPLFCKQNDGSIVVLSSVAGERIRAENMVYGTSKAAVSAFMDGLGFRYRNLHFLTVKPGPVATPMTQGMRVPKLLLAQPVPVARDIVRAIVSRKRVLYTPWYWGPLFYVFKKLPRFLFRYI
jgi:decaprenylphospho-beta-D-erythro-pentofuranosid-2-ulose 2-reductase